MVDDKVKKIMQLAEDLKYLKDEFEVNNRLYGSCPDGYVTLDKFIEYCKDNDYLLEHIIKVSKEVNNVN